MGIFRRKHSTNSNEAPIKSSAKTVMMTPSEAVSFNRDTPNNAFMHPVVSEEDSFEYPEELQPAVAHAGMTDKQIYDAKKYGEGTQYGKHLVSETGRKGLPLVAGAMAIPLSVIGGAEFATAFPELVSNIAWTWGTKPGRALAAKTAKDAFLGTVGGEAIAEGTNWLKDNLKDIDFNKKITAPLLSVAPFVIDPNLMAQRGSQAFIEDFMKSYAKDISSNLWLPTKGRHLLLGEHANNITKEVEKILWERRTNPEFIQKTIDKYFLNGDIDNLAISAPNLFAKYKAGDKEAIDIVNSMKAVSKGHFRMPKVSYEGGITLPEAKGPLVDDEVALGMMVKGSYPLSAEQLITASNQFGRTLESGNPAYPQIIGGIKGVDRAVPLKVGEAAQRTVNKKVTDKSFYDAQFGSNNSATAIFYSSFGKDGSLSAIENLIEAQPWSRETKNWAKFLNKDIEDGLKEMSVSGKGREFPLFQFDPTLGPAASHLTTSPVPYGYSFPGNLNDGKISDTLLNLRADLEDKMNLLGYMLGDQNSKGVLELYALKPRDISHIMTADYRGNWYAPELIDKSVKPTYQLMGYKANIPNTIAIDLKNVDQLAHYVDKNDVLQVNNIIDAMGGPVGTDIAFGRNTWNYHMNDGILKRSK